MDQWETNEPQLEIQPVVPLPTDGLGVLKVNPERSQASENRRVFQESPRNDHRQMGH